jgi:phosphohistidine phosphatase SixA
MATGSKSHLALLLLLACAVFSAPASAADMWDTLKKPGHIVLLRHANAPGNQTESNDMDFKDCTIQRNLDDQGRAQAGRIGDEFRKHKLTKVRLVASQYCRAIDTAKLMKLGPITQQPLLNLVYIADIPAMRDAGRKTREFMKTIPANQLTVIVTHVGNILSTAGVNLDSGEMAVVHLDAAGEVVVDGRLAVP